MSAFVSLVNLIFSLYAAILLFPPTKFVQELKNLYIYLKSVCPFHHFLIYRFESFLCTNFHHRIHMWNLLAWKSLWFSYTQQAGRQRVSTKFTTRRVKHAGSLKFNFPRRYSIWILVGVFRQRERESEITIL